MSEAEVQLFDAILLLSFGGPEGEEEVVPFLENVTRGRGIPRERLRVVGEHYFHFGGVSPLNRLNKEIIANVEQALKERGMDLPVYFGNRNWHPFASQAAEHMARDGVRNALVFATSAWGGYSGCRQYDEDIAAMREHLAHEGLPEITFTKLRQFFDHPVFIEEMAAGLRATINEAGGLLPGTKVMFSAHSVPTAADNASGGPEDANLYSRQVAEASSLIAAAAGVGSYEQVWQSRSGNPATPWLEPDVVDRTLELAGAESNPLDTVIVCPVGFISDHMEVIWDLDTDLKTAAAEHNVRVFRSPTIGHTAAFAAMITELVSELNGKATPRGLGTVSVNGCTLNGAPCGAECCVNARRPRQQAS